MKASGRQEFVIQTKLDDDFVLDVQLCRANMSRTPVIPHIWRRTAMCQANRSLKIPRLHFPCPVSTRDSTAIQSNQSWKKNGFKAYQAVHFGVGNIVGLLGSYLKWTNKMSVLFSQCPHLVESIIKGWHRTRSLDTLLCSRKKCPGWFF